MLAKPEGGDNELRLFKLQSHLEIMFCSNVRYVLSPSTLSDIHDFISGLNMPKPEAPQAASKNRVTAANSQEETARFQDLEQNTEIKKNEMNPLSVQ